MNVVLAFIRPMLLCLPLFVGVFNNASADEFRPAYLQITQTSEAQFDVLWKVPALDENRAMNIQPIFPTDTQIIGQVHSTFAAGMTVQRWTIQSDDGLAGREIAFDNQTSTRIDILIRVQQLEGGEQLQRLLPGQSEFLIAAQAAHFSVIKTYTVIGIEHILLGFDHLLFVLGLLLIVRSLPRLLFTVSAFTLAHSITLSLATLGVITFPSPPVEAVIALSIVFIANEILQQQQGKQTLAIRKPWLIAFAFGLLHGVGFASALAEVGLPENAIPLALLFFNIGVELGQVLFIALLLSFYHGINLILPARFSLQQGETVLVYAIGTVASFWVIERVSSFWV